MFTHTGPTSSGPTCHQHPSQRKKETTKSTNKCIAMMRAHSYTTVSNDSKSQSVKTSSLFNVGSKGCSSDSNSKSEKPPPRCVLSNIMLVSWAGTTSSPTPPTTGVCGHAGCLATSSSAGGESGPPRVLLGRGQRNSSPASGRGYTRHTHTHTHTSQPPSPDTGNTLPDKKQEVSQGRLRDWFLLQRNTRCCRPSQSPLLPGHPRRNEVVLWLL